MKLLALRLIAILITLLFATSCASVTDANLDVSETSEPTIETTTTEGSFWDSRNGDDMDPIIDRPKTGGGPLD